MAPKRTRGRFRVLGTAGILRGIDACHLRRVRPARYWIVAFVAAVTAFWIVAPAAMAAKPFVSVQASLRRGRGLPTVHAQVEWNADAAREEPDEMTIGNLRLLAISDDGHHPTVLDTTTYTEIDKDPTQKDVVLHVDKKDKDAIASGNRVVLTASQHGVTPGATRSNKTFVTVDQLQPFGSKQDRVGRRDCADLAIVPGARLDECDLVGAYLDQAVVSMRNPQGKSTEMRLADLTGATMEGANLSGLNLAGGRLNGADAAGALINNLALQGAEATRLDAKGAESSDPDGGANIYDSRLRNAKFQGAELTGVSFNHSDLDGANFEDSTWQAVEASTASFRGAELNDLKGGGNVEFADFTDAKMRGAPFSDTDLEWATLCHTLMPDGRLEDRDCRAKVDPGPTPAANPKVKVTGSLTKSPSEAKITGTITWNSAAISYMPVAEIRVVAIDGSTGIPTTIAERTYELGATPPPPFEETITDHARLEALRDGNRVVLTATQHPVPPRTGRTTGSYVAVDTLQAGPGRGRVGSRDCSELTIGPSAPEGSLQFCDLAGAVLTEASLAGSMRDSDLTGAELQGAEMGGVSLDGSALGGADMSNLDGGGIQMIDVSAPHVNLSESLLKGVMSASDFDRANFDHATIEGKLASSLLRRANFTSATLSHADLAYARSNGAEFAKAKATSTSLFLADLTNANLAESKWTFDESLEPPWEWATLCHTTLPEGAKPSGDRDCPR